MNSEWESKISLPVDWRVIDQIVERDNLYRDRKEKLRKLKEYVKQLKYSKR